MELHVRLVHAETGSRVVEVRASRGEISLGSALAEAATAQEAEDLAVARLLRRLEEASASEAQAGPAAASAALPPGSPSGPTHSAGVPVRASSRANGSGGSAAGASSAVGGGTSLVRRSPGAGSADGLPAQAETSRPPSSAADSAPDGSAAQQNRPTAAAPSQPSSETERDAPPERKALAEEASPAPLNDPQEEPPADPEDWSQELTAVDLELRRLGWKRDEEGTYLQRAFGHPSRSRLTRYSDLRAYLSALEALQIGSDPALAAVPLRRSELLAQGDSLLARLGWSAEQGRAFLERELSRISRQQLSDVQLLQFNMLLEGELLAGDAGAAAPVAAPEGAQR